MKLQEMLNVAFVKYISNHKTKDNSFGNIKIRVKLKQNHPQFKNFQQNPRDHSRKAIKEMLAEQYSDVLSTY